MFGSTACLYSLKRTCCVQPEKTTTTTQRTFEGPLTLILTQGYRHLLGKHEINLEIINSISFVPVGSSRDRVLANGRLWLAELWSAAVERAAKAGCGFLLMLNENPSAAGATKARVGISTFTNWFK